MNNFMFNVKQLKMNEFIKYIWQLIIITSNATLEVPSPRPCSYYKDIKDSCCKYYSCTPEVPFLVSLQFL